MACAFLFVVSALVGMASRDAAAAARLSDDDRAAIAAELAKSGNVVMAGLTESRIDNPVVGFGSDGQNVDQFGTAVAVDANTAVVGAPQDNIGANQAQGSAYVFVRSGTAWTLQAKLVAADGKANDSFGASVAIGGDTVVIGAAQHSIQTNYHEGAAYVFVRTGTSWALQQTLSALDGSACGNGQFGKAVAISGDTLLAGEIRNCTLTHGVAHVFVRTGSTWTEQAALSAGDAVAYDQSYFGDALALDGNRAVIGAWQWYDGVSGYPGSAYMFTRSGTSWTQQAQLFSPDNEPSSYFGRSVDVSGTSVVVAAPMKTVGAIAYQGAAYVYVQSGSSWSLQQAVTTTDGVSGAYLGNYQGGGVALSGDTLALGAQNGVSGISGARAYIFTRSSGAWSQRKVIRGGAQNAQIGSAGIALDGGTLVAGGPGNPDCGDAFVQTGSGASWNAQATLDRGCSPAFVYGGDFGRSVAVDGDTAVVGVPGGLIVNGSYEGRAYVFVRDSDGWALRQQLVATDAAPSDYFGTDVAISGDRIAVGAPYHQNASSNPGSVYVFVRSGSTWTQEAELTRDTNTGYSGFGQRISLAGDTLLVGSTADNGQFGAAYAYARSGTAWSQQAMLVAGDGTSGAGFGYDVALSGDTALIGAYADTIGSHASQGSAYVFTRSAGTWTQQQKLVAADGASNDQYGYAVALSGDSAVIGAPYHLGGSGTNGQAYVYLRSGAVWAPQATLHEDGAQQYASSVAIDGDTLAVGSPSGYQYLSLGGTYVYWRSGTSWSMHDELANPNAVTGSNNDSFGQSVSVSGGLTFIGAPGADGLPPYGNPYDGAAFAYAYVEATSTAITAVTPEPSLVGTSATVSVSVDGERTAPTAGTVVVSADTGETCTVSTLAGAAGNVTATGSCTLTFTHVGARSLTAHYSGATTFDPAEADAFAHTVAKAQPTLTVTATPEPSVTGQPYSVSVVITGAFQPSGNIVVIDGTSGANCTFSLPATSCLLPNAEAGIHVLGANYPGDANNEVSSASAPHTVNKASTTTTIIADTPDPSEVNQPYTVSVSVAVNTPGTGTPSGSVTVSDGSATCAIALPATSCSLVSTTTGSKTLTASYAGNTNFDASTSAGVPHTVTNQVTTTAITGTTPSPSVVGQSVTIAYSVGAASGTPTGNVTVSASGGESCTGTVAAGACAITFASAGAKALTAAFSGDANYEASSGNGSHTVAKGDVTLAVTTSPSSTVVGQPFTASVTVTASAPASGTPGGSVSLSAGTASCVATLSGSSGSCSLTIDEDGPIAVNASYAGDANFNAGSGSAAHSVMKGNVGVSITTTPSTTVTGQSVAVNVSVTAASPATGTPTGNVAVSAGTLACTATLSGGSGSCNLTPSSAGALSVSANYAGDDRFNAGSGSHAHTVNKAATAASITADTPDPSEIGQTYAVSVALSVTAPGAGTPSGTITVSEGAASCNIVLPATSCSLASATAGTRTLVATYAGDADFNGSTSPNASHTVNKHATTTAIGTATPPTPVVGQSVAIAYSVTSASGTPTGTVTISAASGETCNASVAAGTCSLAFVTAGTKNLTASYAGDGSYATSSGTAALGVGKGDVTVIVSASPSGSVVGQPVTLNATVSAAAPAAGTPSGSVHLSLGSLACDATLSAGAGSCAVAPMAAGDFALQAGYAGSANFNAGSGSGTHTVARATTTLAIVSDTPDPSLPGQSVLVTAALAVTAPGAGTPGGTIEIGDGVDACTATLPAVSCSLSIATQGPRVLTASYAGDANYLASSATADHTVIGGADLAISVDDGASFVQVGEAVVYAIVASNSGPQHVSAAHVTSHLADSLQDANWTCSGEGGGACAASGSGDIDLDVDLPPGASVTFLLAASVVGNDLDDVVQQASIASSPDIEDPQTSNNVATDMDTVVLFRDSFDTVQVVQQRMALETLAPGVHRVSLALQPWVSTQTLLVLTNDGKERARLLQFPLDDGRARLLWVVHEPLAGWRVMATRLVDAGEPQSVQWSLQTHDGSVVLGDVAFGTDG